MNIVVGAAFGGRWLRRGCRRCGRRHVGLLDGLEEGSPAGGDVGRECIESLTVTLVVLEGVGGHSDVGVAALANFPFE